MARAIESLDDSHSATAPPFVRGRFGVSRATACRQRWPHWPPQIVVISPAQSRPGGSIAPAPTATTCSRSCGPHVGRPHRAGAATPTTKPSGSPTPAAGFAINARSTPKPGVSTAHATRNCRPQKAQPHAQNAHPVQRRRAEYQSIVCLGQRPMRIRTTPTRLETTTLRATNTRRRATLLRRTMKILVATALTQGYKS